MQKSVLNKRGKFGAKILWRYTDKTIFVLRCFILTHPVDTGSTLFHWRRTVPRAFSNFNSLIRIQHCEVTNFGSSFFCCILSLNEYDTSYSKRI